MLRSAKRPRLTRDLHGRPSSASSSSHPPHQPVIYPSIPAACPIPPFIPPSLYPAISRLLPSRHITDTPTETSDLISEQEVRGFKFLL
ncbi:hypothetical protein VZT92_007198 [Zoarces viviparus]|uniref:Uncharacterized protein n=1 Tax=Zoarces viviparus TaxID=48416 RepID=A0AAW1FJN1_ZOAVI